MVAFSVLLAAFAAAVPSIAAPAIPIERDVALSEHGSWLHSRSREPSRSSCSYQLQPRLHHPRNRELVTFEHRLFCQLGQRKWLRRRSRLANPKYQPNYIWRFFPRQYWHWSPLRLRLDYQPSCWVLCYGGLLQPSNPGHDQRKHSQAMAPHTPSGKTHVQTNLLS